MIILDGCEFEYKKLKEEMKIYINKAMEIYEAVKDKEIIIQCTNDFNKPVNHTFTKNDKKIFALFAAPLFINLGITKIYNDFDDIKKEDILSCLNIKEEDIKPLTEDYEKYYSDTFELTLLTLIDKASSDKAIAFLAPEAIVGRFKYAHSCGTKVVDYFMYKYLPHVSKQIGHEIFDAIRTGSSNKGSVINMASLSSSSSEPVTLDPEELKELNKQNISKVGLDAKPISESPEDIKEKLLNKETLDLMEELSRKFIGQEKAAKQLFLNLINNQCLKGINALTASQKSTIFVDGPSGTGKSAIIKAIAKKLDVPCIKVAATQFSKTGYVGESLSSIFRKLIKKARGNKQKASNGIVMIDEFDKLAAKKKGNSRETAMKESVQEELLDIMSGGSYSANEAGFYSADTEFDTSKLTFVCLGALTDLRNEKIEKQTGANTMGFKSSKDTELTNKKIDVIMGQEDLIENGIMEELAYRFNTFIHTVDYDAPTLKRQLLESEISPLLGLRQWVEFFGKEFIISDEAIDLIAEEASLLHAGARGNETIIDNIRTLLIEDVLLSDKKTIEVTPELIQQSVNKQSNIQGVR